MENFKEEIMKRSRLIKSGIGALIVFNLCLHFFQKAQIRVEMGLSFQLGACIGLTLIGCILISRYEKALKDDQQLKLLYINEHDERKSMIKQKMSQSALITSVICLMLAVSAAMYIDLVVAVTLMCAMFGILIIVIAFKIYYFKKY